jgi:hypothetical protein
MFGRKQRRIESLERELAEVKKAASEVQRQLREMQSGIVRMKSAEATKHLLIEPYLASRSIFSQAEASWILGSEYAEVDVPTPSDFEQIKDLLCVLANSAGFSEELLDGLLHSVVDRYERGEEWVSTGHYEQTTAGLLPSDRNGGGDEVWVDNGSVRNPGYYRLKVDTAKLSELVARRLNGHATSLPSKE